VSRARGLVAVLVASSTLACVTYPAGELAAVSTTEQLPLEVRVVAEEVEGSACRQLQGDRFKQALDVALGKAPGATALVDVTYTFESFCAVVRGKAVEIR
jgi:hypothetical protein